MEKVALVSQGRFLPVPAIYGGACEELMNIILTENEKYKKANIFYLQKEYDSKTMEILKQKKFESTEMIYIKNNRFIDFCVKAINKVFRKLKIKVQFSTTYDSNVLKYCKKMNFDKIIFQANLPPNIKKYSKYFKKEQLYQQFHTQEPKYDLSKYVGNIIGASKFVTNEWVDYFKENNINNMKSYVLQNLVDENKFLKEITPKERNEIRNKYDFSKDDFIIIFVGRLVQTKGIKQLIEAVVDLPENVKLMIVGIPNFKDKNKSPFLTKIQTYHQLYPNKIKFTGFIDNAELFKYYQSADLHVVPSIRPEAAGLVVLEGLLCGLPSIITNSGGMPEYVGEGTIIIENNDKLIENLKENIIGLTENNKLRQKMVEFNKKHSTKFKKEHYYQNFLEIINDK